MTRVDATVVVLTYNGDAYLQRVLEMVSTQDYIGTYEILVIDSASTDRTLDIVARYPDVRLVEIPNSEFGHGKTRDMAVRIAQGRFIAFLTQDAVPVDARWLRELLAPFAIDDRVAIVTGRQIPRESAFPLQKYDIMHTFASIGSASGTVLFSGPLESHDPKEAGKAGFHSDVNAAVRADLASTSLPFRDVSYSEDQLMGREALDLGYWKAYAGRAAVEHSNDLNLREYGKRLFDETVALRRLGHDYSGITFLRALVATIRGTLGDTVKIAFDDDYSLSQKIKWWFVNPTFQVRRWFSIHHAAHVDLDDDRMVRERSLEHERKSTSGQRGATVPDTSN